MGSFQSHLLVNPEEQGEHTGPTVLVLTSQSQGEQQAVGAVSRSLVRGHRGLGLVMQELPERRVAEGRVVAGVQQELVPHVVDQHRRHRQPHRRAAGEKAEPSAERRLDERSVLRLKIGVLETHSLTHAERKLISIHGTQPPHSAAAADAQSEPHLLIVRLPSSGSQRPKEWRALSNSCNVAGSSEEDTCPAASSASARCTVARETPMIPAICATVCSRPS